MKYLKITFTLIITIISLAVINAQDFQTITNRWKTVEKINMRSGFLQSSAAPNEDWGSQWVLKKIDGTKFSRIENRAKPGYVIHVENGKLEATQMKMGAWSAQWLFKKISGTEYWEIINRWKPNQKLNVEKGRLTLSTIHEGAYSAQWKFDHVSGTYNNPTTTAAQPATSNTAKSSNPYGASTTKNSNPYLNSANGSGSSSSNSNPYAQGSANNNASPTAPAQNFYVPKGPVGKMYFRYTDQVQGGGGLELRVGSKIKVLPNQKLTSASTDMRGISFDPNNPKICGKVFTVQSMSPITFVEEFPEMMRNTHNGSFGFKVEVIQY